MVESGELGNGSPQWQSPSTAPGESPAAKAKCKITVQMLTLIVAVSSLFMTLNFRVGGTQCQCRQLGSGTKLREAILLDSALNCHCMH